MTCEEPFSLNVNESFIELFAVNECIKLTIPQPQPLELKVSCFPTGATLPTFDPNMVIFSDENGELFTDWLQWGQDVIELPVPPDNPEILIDWLKSVVMEVSKLGVMKLPSIIGSSEIFGVLIDPDGVTPASFGVVDLRYPYAPFQVGCLDGNLFGLMMVRPDQSPIMIVTDQGFNLSGSGATVTRIDVDLNSNSNERLPTVKAVRDALISLSGINASKFIDNSHLVWTDVVEPTLVNLGVNNDGPNSANSGSTRHRVSSVAVPFDTHDIEELHIRMSTSFVSADVYGVVYSDNAGAPDQLLYTSDLVTITNNTEQNILCPFSTPFDLTAGSYWIGYRNITGGINASVEATGTNVTYSSGGVLPDDPFNVGSASQNSGTLDAYLVGFVDENKVEATVVDLVDSVNAGTGIDVDNTDPDNPIVGLDSATQTSLGLADTALQSVDWGDIGGTLSSQVDLQDALDDKEDIANKGQANGYASLDGAGKVPVSQLPSSFMQYLGTWNASTNTPTLTDGVGDTGDVYRVSVAGTQNLGSGSISFDVGDWIIYNGTIWQKSDMTDAVASVFGRQGVVTAQAGDYNAGQITNTPAGDIASTDVQGAINELDSEKVAKTTLAASGKGYVNHGATASTVRPSGYASVEWVGSVEPTYAVDGDSWIDTSS